MKTIQSLSQRYSSIFEKCCHDITKLQSVASNLVIAYEDANQSRVVLDKTKKGSPAVSPLDALCRGYMGDKVATLINTLQLHLDDLDNMKHTLQGVFEKLESEATQEVNQLTGLETAFQDGIRVTNSALIGFD